MDGVAPGISRDALCGWPVAGLMPPPDADMPGGASRASQRRKLGRPFKTATERSDATAPDIGKTLAGLAEGFSATGTPPAVPYRSFKITLSVFKQQDALPERLDRAAFSNKLHNTNVREIVEAYRFLGLIDADGAPTPDFRALVEAIDEDHWPETLRGLLERTYHGLLACDPIAVTDGLHRAFRIVYDVGAENTRKRSSFFLHACRDAALPEAGRPAENDVLRDMPVYDRAWPDDRKRQWFGTFHDLVQRLNS